MRILLTGGTGFIGGHLVKAFGPGNELIALARGAPPAQLEGAAEWVEQDLCAELGVERLPSAVDAVVHVAQSRRYADLPAGAGDVFGVNVRGTFALLEYARSAGAKRFLFTSTGGLYRRAARPLTESDPVDPPDLYFASKLAAELLIRSYGGPFGAVVFRPFFVYGPGTREMLVATLARRVLAGEETFVEGDPGVRTNPIAVGDVARAFEAGLEGDQVGTFNLAGEETVSITELIELIGELSGHQPRFAYSDGQPGDLIGDNTRMKAVLGVTPATTLREGLAATIEALSSR